jgi:hypothetical protein
MGNIMIKLSLLTLFTLTLFATEPVKIDMHGGNAYSISSSFQPTKAQSIKSMLEQSKKSEKNKDKNESI